MSSIASALCQPRRSLTSLGLRVAGLVRRTALALQVCAERRRLLRLDDAALKDMGSNKGQADCEASRPFWDVPVDRLRP